MAKKAAVKKEKQKALPGMEDRAIEALNEMAVEYAETRDERQKLLGAEVELKAKLHDLMKKHNKKDYVFDGIEVHIVVESETVKVKVPKKDPDLTATVRV